MSCGVQATTAAGNMAKWTGVTQMGEGILRLWAARVVAAAPISSVSTVP